MSPEITTYKMRPVFSQKSEADGTAKLIVYEHAKHLEPSCTPGNHTQSTSRTSLPRSDTDRGEEPVSEDRLQLPLLTVYLPYMSWMKYGRYSELKKVYVSSYATVTSKTASSAPEKKQPWKKGSNSSLVNVGPSRQVDRKRPLSRRGSICSVTSNQSSHRPNSSLVKPGPSDRVDGKTSWPITPLSRVPQRPQYLTRTLDQFYYPALDDTSDRDEDQTISKWTGTPLEADGRDKATDDSAMIMVDQFWCWIINEKTIITSFPSGIYSYSPTDVEDLYLSITRSLSSDPQQLQTVEGMYSLLVKEAAGYMFNQVNRSSVDMVGIYRWATGKKAATQTKYFQEFQRGYTSSGKNKTIGKDDPIFNDRSDVNLILEVADIIDELKMIQHLLKIQKDVIKSSIQALKLCALDTTGKPTVSYQVEDTIGPLLAQFASIGTDAQHTRKMLLDLSDLKSKAASLAEAHAGLEAAQSSAKEAQEASVQGRAVMLFTIITVIFLPLSFFTSYFGQNVKEFTGDEGNPSTWHLWRVATPITVVVIVVALLVAFYITQSGKASATTGTRHDKRWKGNLLHGLRRLKFWNRNETNNKDVEMNSMEATA
ncbi:hypothetical protein GT037_010904 [Alternaria burnsii]|uniref:Cora-domain-containing protein n=1 Tax=Alternaria burnsii TaxID=1187904 RepID=A0A8H7AX38_9PLEO|nr:uncharacterized protein GT037_010904 [Alternaria burnsii]KAF7670940.1 hypothetical protein GT037_010904 [Alternaria burnsii]